MGTGLLDLARRALLGFIGILIGLGLVVLAVRADGATTAVNAPGVVVHDADETLTRFCSTDAAGTLWLTLPDGTRWELITDIADPAVVNKGDGAFHPMDVAEVRAAIAGVRYPLGAIDADVFVLPYPRRAQLESAAGPGLVMLSPGVVAIPAESQHAIVTHELGHVVHFARMPDRDTAAWDRWRALRGVTDLNVYSASAPHADRPHEIFAEDFRVLFGDAMAAGAGTIENPVIAPPRGVPGLDTFMSALAELKLPTTLAAWPNPSRGAVTFSRSGDTPRPVDVFDVTGRRVATIVPQTWAAGWEWRWDGRADGGRELAPGRYLARERGADGRTAAFTRVR